MANNIVALTKKVFVFDSSEADKRYFRQRIYEYLKGNDLHTLTKTMWNAVWLRNNKGQTSKYLFFNERSQRLYLDNDFFEWCKLMCESISKEMEKLVMA